jgi:RNase P subunit RPR2
MNNENEAQDKSNSLNNNKSFTNLSVFMNPFVKNSKINNILKLNMPPQPQPLFDNNRDNNLLFSNIDNNNNTIIKSIKPFSCNRCQRTFNSKYNVIRHLKQYHADKRMFKCNICGRDYKWIDSLNKHMKMHKKNNDPQSASFLPLNSNQIFTKIELKDIKLDEFTNSIII